MGNVYIVRYARYGSRPVFFKECYNMRQMADVINGLIADGMKVFGCESADRETRRVIRDNRRMRDDDFDRLRESRFNHFYGGDRLPY